MAKLIQNVDYELIPGKLDTWNIRILTGQFVETVISYKAIAPFDDEEHLTFNFDVIESCDEDAVDSNVELQQQVGEILLSIIEDNMKKDIKK
jgi:hypothetical protein